MATFSPDNVHETGVSHDGKSRSPIEAAEAQQVEQLEERPGHGPDPRVFVPYTLVIVPFRFCGYTVNRVNALPRVASVTI
jgi:hypothetical protein